MKKQHIKAFPEKGSDPDFLLKQIDEKKEGDAQWEKGKMFGFVYHPEEKTAAIIQEASNKYFHENAVNPALFNSITWFHNEIVTMVANLLNGDKDVAGTVTTGGTESILMAVKVARDKAKKEKPRIWDYEILLPETAHPAFYKAANYLDVKPVILPVSKDFRADLNHLEKLINEKTILIGASAPSYSHGVIDPIEEIGHIAKKHNLLFHVDACLGGFMLPFLEEPDYKIPLFDFRVPGVTSISTDIHKYGYGAKGTSVILYRNRALRKHQFFTHTNWPGGVFGSPTLSGSRSGGPLVAAWTILKLFGREGYMKLAKQTMEVTQKLTEGINSIEGLEVISNPEMSVFSFTSTREDVHHIGDLLEQKGWHFDRIMEPPGIHLLVTQDNFTIAESFLNDLEETVREVRKTSIQNISTKITSKFFKTAAKNFPEKTKEVIISKSAEGMKGESGSKSQNTAAFYGIITDPNRKDDLPEMVVDILDKLYWREAD